MRLSRLSYRRRRLQKSFVLTVWRFAVRHLFRVGSWRSMRARRSGEECVDCVRHLAVQTFTSGLVKIRAECALVHSSAVSASPVGLTSIGVWLSSIAGSRLDERLIGQRWMVWSDFRQ
jgi:hypothetical protein